MTGRGAVRPMCFHVTEPARGVPFARQRSICFEEWRRMWFFLRNAATPEMKLFMARLSSRPNRAVFWIVPCALAMSVWFWWSCRKNPETHFLPGHRSAEWILYSNPPDVGLYRVAESSAEFRRDFIL